MVALVIAHQIVSAAIWNAMHAARRDTFLSVNRCQLQIELDTGSALTILPASMFHEHFDLPLQPTSTMLKPYAGDRLRPTGVFRAYVCYNGQEFEADAYVVDSDGPSLVGRDWLQNIVFD